MDRTRFEQCSSQKESIGMGESVCLGEKSRSERHSRVGKKQLGTERHGNRNLYETASKRTLNERKWWWMCTRAS